MATRRNFQTMLRVVIMIKRRKRRRRGRRRIRARKSKLFKA
jgi:hypothetical protein